MFTDRPAKSRSVIGAKLMEKWCSETFFGRSDTRSSMHPNALAAKHECKPIGITRYVLVYSPRSICCYQLMIVLLPTNP